MRVAIVGSRNYVPLDDVAIFVGRLPKDTVVISGGAQGVDLVAEAAAHHFGLEFECYPADWQTWGRRAGAMRNAHMVKVCDVLVAFWDGSSPGTKISIDLAERAGKLRTKEQVLGV